MEGTETELPKLHMLSVCHHPWHDGNKIGTRPLVQRPGLHRIPPASSSSYSYSPCRACLLLSPSPSLSAHRLFPSPALIALSAWVGPPSPYSILSPLVAWIHVPGQENKTCCFVGDQPTHRKACTHRCCRDASGNTLCGVLVPASHARSPNTRTLDYTCEH